jgi:hypothetical protein
VRALRLLEVVAAISLGGSLLAISVPAFLRNLHASRLAEPMEGLMQIGRSATDLAPGRGLLRAYPSQAPLTPGDVPAGSSVEDSPETWQHPTWQELGFHIDHAHYFSFAFESKNGAERSSFLARAHGDLDGDGLLSTFQIRGEWSKGGEPELFPIEIQREVE